MTYNEFSEISKVWVYQANRELKSDECNAIQSLANEFVNQWSAHGTQLTACAEIIHNRFLVFFVNEGEAQASGCSIDKSVHFVKLIQTKFGLDFFDRMQIAYRTEKNTIKTFDYRDLESLIQSGILSENTIIFNNSVTTKRDWKLSWETPLNKSWMADNLSLVK